MASRCRKFVGVPVHPLEGASVEAHALDPGVGGSLIAIDSPAFSVAQGLLFPHSNYDTVGDIGFSLVRDTALLFGLLCDKYFAYPLRDVPLGTYENLILKSKHLENWGKYQRVGSIMFAFKLP